MQLNESISMSQLKEILGKPSCRIHLIGVAGSGMSGLAALLLARGYRISGSDLKRTEATQKLEKSGLTFYPLHESRHVEGIDLIVFSSAIDKNNPERAAAKERGIPEVRRAELLVVLSEGLQLFAVAGSHGKTTSATLLTHTLRHAGLDPSFYIGADVPLFGTNAAWGKGKHIVIELDESDGSIDLFSPASTLILNIEKEHLDYFKTLEWARQAFKNLVSRTSQNVVLCRDDVEASALLDVCQERGLSYGLSEGSDYQIKNLELSGDHSTFEIHFKNQKLASLCLNLPGQHNALNAAGVFAIAHGLGISTQKIEEAFLTFKNAKRRFEILFQDESFCVIDDYAHHPTEIRATIAAGRKLMEKLQKKRLVVAFQPHRYSRTRDLYADFLNAFEGADLLYLTEIYAASEAPIDGISGEKLAQHLTQKQTTHFYSDLKDLRAQLSMALEPGDLLLMLGAGDIEEVAHAIAGDLNRYSAIRSFLTAESGVKAFEPLKKHTSMRVGGPADVWVEPANEEELAKVVRYCRKENLPITMIGRGSNLIIQDRGIRGICIHLSKPYFQTIEVRPDQKIYAAAGARLRQIVTDAKRAGIGGFEFMEGIPAALGGALRMNAGAMHSSTFEVVESVRWMDSEGNIHESKASEIEVRYRHVPLFDNNIALGALLHGSKTSPEEIGEKLSGYSKKRWASQPAAPSAGCIFKNPTTTQAGKLIDQLGLKDTRRGGARVSPVHGNFIVNEGGATANDILSLIDEIKAKVYQASGIQLETEAIILGE